MLSHFVMSNSVWPYELQPAMGFSRLDTGVGCHALHQGTQKQEVDIYFQL